MDGGMLQKLSVSLLIALALVWLTPRSSRAEEPNQPPGKWTSSYPSIEADVAAGKPLTLLVVVPLCDSHLIHCGGQGAGDPGSLDKNLYWGRAFGARRYFDERAKQFRRVARETGTGPMLEQLVYRRWVPGAPWGSAKDVEQLVVLRAIHGAEIDAAVRDFYHYATAGAHVSFEEQGQTRMVRVHAVGYAGHNRLMDVALAQIVGATETPSAGAALPSFVFACRSAPYFSQALANGGSTALVMTRDLMAPEGYVIEAMARGLGDHLTQAELRQRVVTAYARWQRIPERTGSSIFARPGR
jgi:hypothetical protein